MGCPPQPHPLCPPPWWPGQPLPWPVHRPEEAAPLEPWLLRVDRRDSRLLSAMEELQALLTGEERYRVDRYRRPEDRQRALLGRGVLRLVLGDWLGLDPASLRFATGSHGKPELVGSCQAPSQSKAALWQPRQSEQRYSKQYSKHFHSTQDQDQDQEQEKSPQFSSPQIKPPRFNISHSGDLILLALHTDAPVGVDVERIRPDLDWRPIARRCLAPARVESLLALPPAEAVSAFVECWCALEAGLKARGVGLAQASDAHVLVMEPRLRRWRLALPSGYGGSVALLDPA